MNLENAINTFQIPNGINPTDEYLKKRYRFIASKIHPDKFTNPREKLLAHHDFLELQDAYEYLQSISLNERCLKTERNSTVSENEINESNHNYESEYVEKKKPYDWLYTILLPGAILNLMFLSIPMVVSLFFEIDVKDKSNTKAEYFGNLILYLIFGAIPMLFAFGVIIFFAYKKIENGSWIWWFIAIEILLANLYFGISYLKRKFFSRKIKTDLIFSE